MFGGSGFLGRAVVRCLGADGVQVRAAARRLPDPPLAADVEAVQADLRDPISVARAAADAHWIVNAVGLYRESGPETFQAVHVEGARAVAEAAGKARSEALVHISGIGVDPRSESAYVRARAAGESAARDAFAGTVVLRPSALFGPDDAFTNSLARIARLLPVFPLFGKGGARLQPVYVADLAAAVGRALARPEAAGRTYELGGRDIVSYRELIELLMRQVGIARPLLPVPLALWQALAWLTSALPRAPVTRDQIALVRRDNLADPSLPGFAELGLEPAALADILPSYLGPGVR